MRLFGWNAGSSAGVWRRTASFGLVAVFIFAGESVEASGSPPPISSEIAKRHLPGLAEVARDDLYRALVSGRIDEAEYALQRALSLFYPEQVSARFGFVSPPGSRTGTLIMRDLSVRMGELSPSDRRLAYGLVARPATGFFHCTSHFCVHWEEGTSDAPPPDDSDDDGIPDQVELTAEAFEEAWADEIDQMGYRPPKPDVAGPGSPDSRVDVFLQDLEGNWTDWGYVTSDDPNASSESYPYWDVYSYVVVDRAFTRPVYGGLSEQDNLTSTASHEFFHAVQFSYDYWEDSWILEGTAVWIDEALNDHLVNYLAYLTDRNPDFNGPLRFPGLPLDRSPGYASWFWWIYLSERLGTGGPMVIREIWERLDGAQGGPNEYSLQATKAVMAERGQGFASVFADYAVANYLPEAHYVEGFDYVHYVKGRAPVQTEWTLSKARPKIGGRSMYLDHLSSGYVSFRPGRGVAPDAGLKVTLDLSALPKDGSATLVVLYTSGGFEVFTPSLDGGSGRKTVPFGAGEVSRVVLAMTNASSRFHCWEGTSFSCQGDPMDDGVGFTFSAKVTAASVPALDPTPIDWALQESYDGNDSPGELDIRTAALARENGQLTVVVEMYEQWDWQALDGPKNNIYMDFDTRGDKKADYYAWIDFSDGFVSGGIDRYEDDGSVAIAEGTISSRDAYTAELTFSEDVLGSPKRLRWFGSTQFRGQQCDEVCWDWTYWARFPLLPVKGQ